MKLKYILCGKDVSGVGDAYWCDCCTWTDKYKRKLSDRPKHWVEK